VFNRSAAHENPDTPHQIHPNARTTPAVRAEIARSPEPPSGLLARRYGVSAETIRKWRKRGVADCLDRSARPHRLPWKATDEERAVVCLLRETTNFTPSTASCAMNCSTARCSTLWSKLGY
jgi:transposase-like protein